MSNNKQNHIVEVNKMVSSIDKEFVPHQESLELKKLGFNEPCFAVFPESSKLLKINGEPRNWNDNIINGETTSTPTISQAFRFFRNKYSLKHTIWSGKVISVFYGYDILHIEKQEFVVNNAEDGGGDCDYETYEEAELECLRKLIKITQESNNA